MPSARSLRNGHHVRLETSCGQFTIELDDTGVAASRMTGGAVHSLSGVAGATLVA